MKFLVLHNISDNYKQNVSSEEPVDSKNIQHFLGTPIKLQKKLPEDAKEGHLTLILENNYIKCYMRTFTLEQS